MIFVILMVAALLFLFGVRLAPVSDRRSTGFRREGFTFVFVTLLVAAVGFLTTARPVSQVAPDFALQVLAVCAVLYVLLALRGSRRWPPWIADALVLLAAISVIEWFGAPRINGIRVPIAQEWMSFGAGATAITVGFVWLISRMTASLNRTPLVTGGYLGIVALTLLAAEFMGAQQSPASGWEVDPAFGRMACAALAGSGLASLLISLKTRHFNLGWPASFAMGFLLGQIAVASLSKYLAFTIMALLLLVFGLPVLDVSFYHLRAARRGQNVKWQEKRARLHEALLERGFSPAKVSFLYLIFAATLCGIGVLVVATKAWYLPIRLLFLVALSSAVFITFLSVTRILMRRGASERVPESVEAFGVKISAVTMDEALDKVDEFIASRQPHHVATSDANAILTARADPEYAQILQNAALITPDGYGVIWGIRLMNLPIYERVTGVDMVTGICSRAAEKGYRVCILGSEPGVAATAAHNLAEKYPGLNVVATYHGFWRRDGKEAGLSVAEADAKMADEICRVAPDVLFVAMGIPMQEKFIAAQLQRMKVPVAIGVGGSFDVYSGKFNRAPEGVQRLGMEWLYRVWIDPSRWKRMGYVPRFMMLALQIWLFGERKKPVKTK